MLTASGHDRPTVGPGPRSFTTALISSLKGLLDECGDRPFTIRQLCERINLVPERRKNQSHVWSRLNRFDRNIALAPLKRTDAERQEEFNLEPTRARLSLRLSLTKERLNEQQINKLARAFSKAVKNSKVPVQRINWWRLHSSGRTTSFVDVGRTVLYGTKWKNKILSSRDSQPPITTQDQTVQTINAPHAQTSDEPHTLDSVSVEAASESTPPPHTSRKRKHSGGHSFVSSSESTRRSLEDSEQRQKLRSYLMAPTPLTPMTPMSGAEPDTN
jgi:hypothetical protein